MDERMKRLGDEDTQVVSTVKEYRPSLIELCDGRSSPLLVACVQTELEFTDKSISDVKVVVSLEELLTERGKKIDLGVK